MPKGVPKTDGEKLKDKFDANYGKMKSNFRKGGAKKGRNKSQCDCSKCKAKK